jgi:hypothetical protein
LYLWSRTADGRVFRRVTRWTVATLVVVFVVGAVSLFVARMFGASGTRAAAMITIASHWIAAWMLWTFVGGLLLQTGVLVAYESALFPVIALAGAWLQYRALVSGARDRARAIFVGVQLAWLVVLLARNGVFSPASR